MDFVGVSRALNGPGERQVSLLKDDLLTQLEWLAAKWRDHSVADLRLRHETGALLNEHFGNPDQRQAYGQGVMDEVSERLGIGMSDLSRMRRFAQHFKSLEDLMDRHPGVFTWSDVRQLLPTLKATSKRDGEPKASASPKASGRKSAKVRGMKQSLESLTQRLKEAREGLSDDERKELLKTFRALAQAVEDCLKVRVSLKAAGEETQPPSGEKVTAEAGNPAKVKLGDGLLTGRRRQSGKRPRPVINGRGPSV